MANYNNRRGSSNNFSSTSPRDYRSQSQGNWNKKQRSTASANHKVISFSVSPQDTQVLSFLQVVNMIVRSPREARSHYISSLSSYLQPIAQEIVSAQASNATNKLSFEPTWEGKTTTIQVSDDLLPLVQQMQESPSIRVQLQAMMHEQATTH